MKIKPLFDRVLGQVVKDNENLKTLSGIQLIDKEQVKKAKVIAVGDELKDNNLIKIGCEFYFEDYVVANLKINHEDFILIKATDILAIKEEN